MQVLLKRFAVAAIFAPGYHLTAEKLKRVLIVSAWLWCVSVCVKARWGHRRRFFFPFTGDMRRLPLLIGARILLRNCCLLDRRREALFLRHGRGDWSGWRRFNRRLQCHQTDDADAYCRRNSEQIAKHDNNATHRHHSTAASALPVAWGHLADEVSQSA
jgi:hypothetical protein